MPSFPSGPGAAAPAPPSALLEGLGPRRGNPGSLEALVREANAVITPETYGRGLFFAGGNPLNANFGVTTKIGMIGAEPQQQGGMMGMMGGPRPSAGAAAKKNRKFEAGAYVKEGGAVLEGRFAQDCAASGRWEHVWSKRLRSVVAARVADAPAPSDLSGALTFRGSTYTVSARGGYGGRARAGPVVGGSYLQSVTPRIAVGGEAYLNVGEALARRADGESAATLLTSAGAPPSPFAWSVAGAWNAPARQFVLQYGGGGAGGLLYCYGLERVSPHVKLASRLIVRPRDARSQLEVGGSVEMPRTRGKVTAVVSSVGRVRSVWERRLLSTVRLRVSSELDFWGQRGHQFGICLQSGYVPQPVRNRTPVLTAWNREYDGGM